MTRDEKVTALRRHVEALWELGDDDRVQEVPMGLLRAVLHALDEAQTAAAPPHVEPGVESVVAAARWVAREYHWADSPAGKCLREALRNLEGN